MRDRGPDYSRWESLRNAGGMVFGHRPLGDAYPYMNTACVPCPGCDADSGMMTFASNALHLNDVHRWSREQIADWLFQEEEKIGFLTLTEEASERVIQHLDVTEDWASVSQIRI